MSAAATETSKRPTPGPSGAGGRRETARPPAPGRSPLRLILLGGALVAAVLVLAAVHLTQGNAAVTVGDLLDFAAGRGTDDTTAVVMASRIPRLAAGLLVGIALGAAGAAMQSVSRNVLASPDTLAVNAGAHLAIVAVAAFGAQLPLLGSAGIAFAGGLGAAALVLALSGLGGSGSARLVLAGSAIALGLGSLTTTLLLLLPQETRGLFAWGSGSLGQRGLDGVTTLAPLVAACLLVLLLGARKLDLLALGDDQAAVLGVRVRPTRIVAVLMAILLATAAVTLTGPIGFVGLAAPALMRLAAQAVPGLHRHAALIPFAAATGVVVVLAADVGLRAVIGSAAAIDVPTDVVTSLLGAVFLVVLALRLRAAGEAREARGLTMRSGTTPAGRLLVVGILVLAVLGIAVAAVLLGDAKLLLGDVANWLGGRAGPVVSSVMDARMPRVVAALIAGAALAIAGTIIQSITRNPLAEPSILGVSGGAGVGAITVITVVPAAGFWLIAGAAGIGAAVAALLVFGLALRGGLATDRLVLIGIGVSSGATAVITLLIVATDPFNQAKALTWLSGSTYGRSFENLVPLALALAVAVPVVCWRARELDLLSLDDATPAVLGVNVVRSRFLLLACAVLLTAAAVAGIGVIGFVGLVAPHAARGLVGRRHAVVLPVAALLGAVLVCLSDLLGRAVIAPAQLPAGLLVAVIGTPYFIYLLHRSRRAG